VTESAGWTKSKEWIEKVVIAGFPAAPSSVTLGSVSLTFSYDANARKLEIKKPECNAADDFIIVIAP
jgi:hypothetical protein